MKNIYEPIHQCPLFKDINEDRFFELIKTTNYRIEDVKKNHVIASEDDDCTSIGIVLEGAVEVKKIYPSGKSVTVAQLSSGNMFGEVILFSDKRKYPSTIQASTKAKVFFMTRESFVELSHEEPSVMTNLLNVLSRKILILNNQLKNLSYESIRQKIANFLIQQYGQQQSDYLTLPMSRQKMAEILGVPRPSLSRELIKMKDDGLLDFHKNTVKIMDLLALEDALYQEK
jgi:CRP-like cAMP-binding protein